MIATRDALADRDDRGHRIQEAVYLVDGFAAAKVVSSYVGIRSEVPTRGLIGHLLFHAVTVAVPWREGDELALTRLDALEELVPSSFGLFEPSLAICGAPERELLANACDVLLIPGLAFDRAGARLGYGRGYYDRLLRRCRPDALRVGLAYDCQVVERVPTGPDDERVHLIVTESGVTRAT
jgi:5-formyltetrahydrofolate cyclo-ligase